MVVGARLASLSILETTYLQGLNGLKNRNYAVSCGSLDKNTLLMSEVRGETTQINTGYNDMQICIPLNFEADEL